VELLVILVIGSVIYAAAVGPMKAYLEKKRAAKCAENMRKLHLVLGLYANDHNGSFPFVAGAKHSDDAFAVLVPQYTSDPAVFSCPVPEKKTKPYAYVMGLTRDDSAPLVMDAAGSHTSAPGNVLFVDGHLETFQGTRRLPALPPRASILEPSP
jgi:prepilin-type processing-associated H-X9-DG protein